MTPKMLELRKQGRKIIIYCMAGVIMFYLLAPVIWITFTSIFTEKDLVLLGKKFRMPSTITLENYIHLFIGFEEMGAADVVKSLFDSFAVASLCMMICLVGGSLAGYAFARVAFPKKSAWFTFLLIIQSLPGMSMIIPAYVLFRSWGLFDTHIAPALLQATFYMPYVIWLLLSFFKSIPVELEEAALVDGCSRVKAFYKIILPLVRPGLFACMIYSFLISWGEFLFVLILTGVNVHPITILISRCTGAYFTNYGWLAAETMVSIIPPLILALVFRNYLMKGLIAGAVKG